jgi:hypothetical protein
MAWALVLGPILALCGGLFALVVGGWYACDAHNVCFAPSDPATVDAGVSVAADGGTLIVLPPTGAAEVTEVEVFGVDSEPSGDTLPAPIWKIERTGPSPASWDGTIEVGVVPAGFREVVPLAVPATEARAVTPSNGCYGATSDVPSTLPSEGSVAVDGETVSLTTFRADWDSWFTPCPGAAEDRDPPAVLWAALAAAALGLGLLVVAGIVRAH